VCSMVQAIRHPNIRVKHGSWWAFTPTAVTSCADVFVYKTESCNKTMFRKKALQAICSMWDFKFSRRQVWCSELSSGLYCRVKWLSTDVSEVRNASIIIPDDGGSTHLRNVGRQSFYTVVQPRRRVYCVHCSTGYLVSRRKLTML